MNRKKITNFEIATLNYFVTRAFIIGITFNALINAMKQDSWIIPLLGIIPGIIFALLVDYFMSYEPSLNFYEKINKLFNKKISYIIVLICIIFCYLMCTINYLNLNSFIQSQFLTKTPLLAISILFAGAGFYILIKGINTLSRTSVILFYISFMLLILSSLGLFNSLNISNLKPFFSASIGDFTKGLNIFYAFNITPMFLITIIPKDKIKNPNLKNCLLISYIISAITIFLITFATLATFGFELSSLYEYAEFHVLKHVSIFGLNSRIESILVMQLLFDVFMYNILSVYFISINIKNMFKFKKENFIYFIVYILIIIGTLFLSKYNIYLDKLMVNIIPIFVSILTILIVTIICIKIKISKN